MSPIAAVGKRARKASKMISSVLFRIILIVISSGLSFGVELDAQLQVLSPQVTVDDFSQRDPDHNAQLQVSSSDVTGVASSQLKLIHGADGLTKQCHKIVVTQDSAPETVSEVNPGFGFCFIYKSLRDETKTETRIYL